uniref:TEP1-F n=1 Tax=Glossina pallidipes TaxID=7398 RepID=A0A1B0ABH0_GLOPL
MFKNFYLVYCILHMIWLARGNGIYSIVAPKTLQSNHKYSVSVTLHDAKQPVRFNIGITGPSYNHSEAVNLFTMETTQIDFVLPKLDGGPYLLISKGVEGLDFENATELHVTQSTSNVYMQTDKAMYKPGDLVQYRILVLDETLRPTKLKEASLKVTIKDAQNNLVRDTKNVKLIKGVFSDKLQLTEQPVLGVWKIEVSLNDHVEKAKTFEVAKYVLPKFSVDIDTVADLAITEGLLKVTIRAKYTYGKPVKGKATVRLSPVNLEKTIDVNGKGHVEFDLQKELKSAVKEGAVEIFAVVQEELTDSRQNNTIVVKFHSSQYIIKIPNAVGEFEPNKPFEVKAVIQYLNGKPVRDTVTPALLQCRQGWEGNIKSEIFKAKLDDHGEAIFAVKLPQATVFRCEIEFVDKTVHLPPIHRKIDEDNFVTKTRELTLTLVNKTPRVGEDVSIAVKASNPFSYLVYVIVGRGNILQMRNIPLPNPQDFFTITFKSTFEMIPNAHVFVYYVDNGDLKFQEIGVKIQPEFENKIEVTGSSQAKPGQEVTLNVKTDPNSYVGLLGVDQSVLLLKSGNDLHRHAILNDLRPYKNWEENEWGRSVYKVPGKKSGLLVMTNSHYPYKVFYMMASPTMYQLRTSVAMPTSVNAFSIPAPVSLPAPLMRSAEPQRIRKDFAEVWLYDSLDDNNETGHLTLTKSLPDT